MRKLFENRFVKVTGIVVGAILGLYVLVVIIRIPHAIESQRTAEAVAKIHATKLTLDDVMGVNLPPDPGADADKTLAGVDANRNGIRDDVELAIFKAYPDSPKTRAPLLQYALALQMQFTQDLVNSGTATSVAKELSRGSDCVGELVPRKSPESSRRYSDIRKIEEFISFVEQKQLNTEDRRIYGQAFEENIRSYQLPIGCDLDLTKI